MQAQEPHPIVSKKVCDTQRERLQEINKGMLRGQDPLVQPTKVCIPWIMVVESWQLKRQRISENRDTDISTSSAAGETFNKDFSARVPSRFADGTSNGSPQAKVFFSPKFLILNLYHSTQQQ